MSRPLSRRQLLWSGIGAATLGALGARSAAAGRRAPASTKRLLYVYVSGGWDPCYSFDPKTGVPGIDGPHTDPSTGEAGDIESVATIHGHRVAVNEQRRPEVLRYFETWGPQTLSLVGVTIGGIAHYPNRLRLLTGGTDRTRPDLVALLGHHADISEPFGAIDLSGWSFQGPHGATLSRVGRTWQLDRLLSPGSEGLGAPLSPDPAEDDLVEGFLRRRAAAHAASRPDTRWPVDLSASVDRLEVLRDRRDELLPLFDRDPASADDNLDLAIDLLDGRWARAVMVDAQYYFDTHSDNADQSGLNDALFAALGRMMQRLTDRQMLDDTVVVVASEMTRSLQLNRFGGKDHWPLLATLVMGGGTVGGRTLGATDDRLAPVPVDLATGVLDPGGDIARYDQQFAGLLAHLGLDPAEHVPGVAPLGGLDHA